MSKAVQEVLGHEHLNTTEIYTHIDNEALRVAAVPIPVTGEAQGQDRRVIRRIFPADSLTLPSKCYMLKEI